MKEPSKTSGGLLYRATVEFGAIGLTGDKDAAKFREYKDLDSGAYLNNFTVMLEKPKSAFHFDAVGGGVGRDDQYYGVDVGRYNTWRVRGSFSETPHVFTTTYRSLWDGVGSDAAHVERTSPGRHHRREHDPGEHAAGDLVRAGRRPRADPEEEPGALRPHAACELESLRQLYPRASGRQPPLWRRLWRWRRWRQRRDPGIDRLQHAGRAWQGFSSPTR